MHFKMKEVKYKKHRHSFGKSNPDSLYVTRKDERRQIVFR